MSFTVKCEHEYTTDECGSCGWKVSSRWGWWLSVRVFFHAVRSRKCRRGDHGVLRLLLEYIFKRKIGWLK